MTDIATARRAVLTEQDIQRGITDLLETLGYICYHTRFAIGSDAGFPDIFACNDAGYIIAVECKGPRGKVRPGQREWIDRIGKSPSCLFAAIVGPSETDNWEGYEEAIWCIRDAWEVPYARLPDAAGRDET